MNREIKSKSKKGMLFDCQLKTADLYNICNGSGQTLACNYFDEEKYVLHYENLQLYFRLRLKLKKHTSFIRIQSMAMVETIY